MNDRTRNNSGTLRSQQFIDAAVFDILERKMLTVLCLFPNLCTNIGIGRCSLSFEQEVELLVKHIALSVLKPKIEKIVFSNI